MTTDSQPRVEALICAYNHSISNVLKHLPEKKDDVGYLVSHQISSGHSAETFAAHYQALEGRSDVRLFTIQGSGLSNNRNNALKHAVGELLLITDDDVGFMPDWSEKIASAFDEMHDAQVITFRVETPEGRPFKKYYPNGFTHTKLSIFRVSSIEVCVKRIAIVESKVCFDPTYGLNAHYLACEETVFLSDLRKKNARIRASDKVIAIHAKESSGSDYSRAASCIVRGAVIRRVFGIFGFPLVLAFSIKHLHEYKTHHSFLKFFRMALYGFFKAPSPVEN